MIKKITLLLFALILSWSFTQGATTIIDLERDSNFDQTPTKRNYLWNDIPVIIEINEKNDLAQLENIFKKMVGQIGVNNFINAEKIVFTFKSNPSLIIFYSSFTVNGNEIEDKLVQGIVFYINDDENLVYNFSIFEEKLLVRINGLYENMGKIKSRIANALENPSIFIQKNDPTYILNQTIINGENIEEANQSIEEINESLNKFILAWLAYENKSFFGAPIPVSESIVEKIIDIKKNDNSLSSETIAGMLKEENVNKNVVDLVLALNFSEFRK